MGKLTIGMAVYEDYHGVAFTVQALRMYHGWLFDELIVVDQSPDSEHGDETRKFIESVGARYIAMPTPRGTTQSRQRIFDAATGDWVMVMDSHVLLQNGSPMALARFMMANPNCSDLIQGPLLYDYLGGLVETEFREEWREEMWGTWYADERGKNPSSPPYEIWAQGLGLFACRREAWPGFDRRWRDFGGEEGCIHEVFRQRGDKCLCLPGLRWWHRFPKPGVSRYPVPTWSKVRNYVLGFQRIGRDLEEIRRHFVDGYVNGKGELIKKMTQAEWEILVANPEVHENPPAIAVATDAQVIPPTSSLPQPGRTMATIDELAAWVAGIPRDLDQHADAMAQMCGPGDVVVEITKRRESTVFLARGKPAELHTITQEPDPIHQIILDDSREQRSWSGLFSITARLDNLTVEPRPCDVLYIDSEHREPRLLAELRRHGVHCRKRLIIRSTAAFGEVAEFTAERGLYFALGQWFEEERQRGREWVRTYRADHQWGISVYSCEPGAVDIDIGPGTELKAILRRLGIVSGPNCECNSRVAVMDQRGVDGCAETRDEIVSWIKDGAPRWGWADHVKAAALAVITGEAWRLNPLDPYGSLVDLAIARARAKMERNERAKE